MRVAEVRKDLLNELGVNALYRDHARVGTGIFRSDGPIDKTTGDGGDSLQDNYLWRQVLARVHAHRGDLAEAEKLAREAVAGSEQSDSLDDQCLALWDLAEVLAVAERLDEAEAALEQALERCRRKKNLARAAQVRRRHDSLRHDASPA